MLGQFRSVEIQASVRARARCGIRCDAECAGLGLSRAHPAQRDIYCRRPAGDHPENWDCEACRSGLAIREKKSPVTCGTDYVFVGEQ
jgi:hypothetical protein